MKLINWFAAILAMLRAAIERASRRRLAKQGEVFWQCADGRLLRLKEMESSHIVNARRMLDRRIHEASRTIAYARSLTVRLACEAIKTHALGWQCRFDAELARRDAEP